MSEKRSCGILMHISSLPSPHGIGTFGEEAYKFVDFLKKAGQTYWQILPIGPTGYGDSPYQSYSAFAGNPLFIDIDMLISEGLVSPSDPYLEMLDRKGSYSDYEELFVLKKLILQSAADKFYEAPGEKQLVQYNKFCTKNAFWLDDYALFMSLKYHFKMKMWTQWDDDIRLREKEAVERYTSMLERSIKYWKFVQFKFFRQYRALKKYANKNGIRIYGDIPIYVSMDSSDIWASPELFMLDEDRKPVKVAGCPPDAFSPTGQLWGNPLYNWEKMEETGFKWWIARVKYSAKLFDLTRIDHFRGFAGFYAVPAADETAENGEWLEGPGLKLFDAIKDSLGHVNLVAEDLGFLTEDVHKMLAATGYPGMNVIEFAFDEKRSDSSYLPHNFSRNSVVYIGTHDNDTAVGWYTSLNAKTAAFVRSYIGAKKDDSTRKIVKKLIRTVYSSVSDLAIIQMQDLLFLDNSARMNIPSTIGGRNWLWRMEKGCCTEKLAKYLLGLSKLYFRAPAPDKKAVPFHVLSSFTETETKE